MKTTYISASLDQLACRKMRYLQEASRLGTLHVLLWSDAVCRQITGSPPKFPLAERKYFVDAVRYVHEVTIIDRLENADGLPDVAIQRGATWAVPDDEQSDASRDWCRRHGLDYQAIAEHLLEDIPGPAPVRVPADDGRPRVLVTGCYDWFHSGHVRFFEEVSQLGRLFVVVGHDANIRRLKGEGHPMFPATERRYLADSIRYVEQALISSGEGWLDAEPEIESIRPDIYAVNEDGDRPEKREYCQSHGIEYRVLKRTPKEGLPRRQSTDLRGF